MSHIWVKKLDMGHLSLQPERSLRVIVLKKGIWNEYTFVFSTTVTTVPWIDVKLTVHNEGSGCRWSFRILFLCVSSLKPNNFWSNLNYQLSSYESAEVVTPSAHYNRTYWNQSSPSNAWNACFLCLNAISYSQRLFPLITFTLKTICLIK